MESSANAIREKEETMMCEDVRVNNCALHAHSKPLEVSWLKAFGEPGNGNKTISQLVYLCSYIQGKLGEKFKHIWKKLVGEDWEGPLLPKFVLSRWGYPLRAVLMVFLKYLQWKKFILQLYEAESHSSLLGNAIKDAAGLVKNTECQCLLSFLSSFSKYYWTPMVDGRPFLLLKNAITYCWC